MCGLFPPTAYRLPPTTHDPLALRAIRTRLEQGAILHLLDSKSHVSLVRRFHPYFPEIGLKIIVIN